MLLAVGQSLSFYEILAPLGAGGMAEVYRALDTRLERTVAIKVLSDEVADVNARRRFQREAQAASSLNHPHIVIVHDVGDHEGRQYLVPEYVDGGTLQEWLRPGDRSWRQVVELLSGVASGLASAHAAGIRAASPAVTGLTRPGIVMGTIAYMSPEQAVGKPVDARSDNFSFGVVLYEALTGRQPFAGATDLELLQNVLHEPAHPLEGDFPAELRVIVEKALEKDPADRYQSIGELAVDLRRALRSATNRRLERASPAATGATQTARRARIVAPSLAALALGALAGRFWRGAPPAPAPSIHPVRLTEMVGMEETPALSRDGKTVAFVARVDGRRQVFLRRLGAGAPDPLTNDDADHSFPRWVDDSTLIYFRHPVEEGGLGSLCVMPRPWPGRPWRT